MSIECYLLNGKFEDIKVKNFKEIMKNLDGELLNEIPVSVLVELFSKFAKKLMGLASQIEGAYYLATWLRESNLNEYLSINFGETKYLDNFVKVGNNKMMRAQPRGVVCHWISGNISTLAIFSLIQSILCKNVNILRIPKKSVDTIIKILEPLREIEVEYLGRKIRGSDLLKTFSIIYFPSNNKEVNKNFSELADCKVMLGGKEAIESILKLPQKITCENIVFGPKYSFIVIDEESITPELCKKLSTDIFTFEQNACSSPHTIFCEVKDKNKEKIIKNLSRLLEKEFKKINLKYKKPEGNYTEIINTKGEYFFDPKKDIISSKELDWAIFINNSKKLEEPLGLRNIFIKPIDSIFETLPLINHKIQTIGIALEDHRKSLEFCEKATYQGASRCVDIGSMNDYDTPWDGILFMNRLVRWTSMTTNGGNKNDT